jgi:hypothetical protein
MAFERDHRAAMQEIPRYLAEKLREIRLVEFTFPDNPVTSGGHGPRRSLIVSDRVTDVRERELGEATRVDVRLGPANLEALDTLIMAGIADDRAAAVRWVLARFRQQPEYEQLPAAAADSWQRVLAFRPARPARLAMTGLRCGPGDGPGRDVLQVPLQAGPDSALHSVTQWLEQRAEHPHPALRVHLPVPAHDCGGFSGCLLCRSALLAVVGEGRQEDQREDEWR